MLICDISTAHQKGLLLIMHNVYQMLPKFQDLKLISWLLNATSRSNSFYLQLHCLWRESANVVKTVWYLDNKHSGYKKNENLSARSAIKCQTNNLLDSFSICFITRASLYHFLAFYWNIKHIIFGEPFSS